MEGKAGGDNVEKDVKKTILEFDKKMLAEREYHSNLQKMVSYFYEIVSIPLIVIIAATGGMKYKEVANIMFWMSIFYVAGILGHLKPYMIVGEKGRSFIIYEILQYVPVKAWDIFRVRLTYVTKIVLCRALCMIVLEVLVMAGLNNFRIGYLIYPVLINIIAALLAVLCILPYEFLTKRKGIKYNGRKSDTEEVVEHIWKRNS